MNSLEELKAWCELKVEEHPDLATQINDFYELCVYEVEQGESLSNEISLCKDSIEQLILGEQEDAGDL